MSTLFRLAIVGAGRITENAHLPAALASRQIELVALIDPVLERARRLIWQYGIQARAATRLGDILDAVDGVVIATPNHTHGELARECLQARVPVLVEKPLATSVVEAESIVKAAEEHRTMAAVGYCQRFVDSVQLMRRLVQDRYFGGIRSFAYQFGTVGGWAPLSGYNLDRQSTGGGVLVVTGTHFLDRMLYWFGYPDDFEYQDDSCGGPEANSWAVFRYTNGGSCFEGTVRFSKTVPLNEGFVMESEQGLVIHRDGIHLRCRGEPSLELTIQDRSPGFRTTGKNMFQLQLEDFVSAVQAQREPMSPAKEALKSVQLIEALYARRTPMKTDWYNHGARELAR